MLLPRPKRAPARDFLRIELDGGASALKCARDVRRAGEALRDDRVEFARSDRDAVVSVPARSAARTVGPESARAERGGSRSPAAPPARAPSR